MTRFTLTFLSFIMVFGFSQEDEMIEIETHDGNIFLGEVVEESSEGYHLKTQDGIVILVPSESIKSINSIKTITSKKGDVWRADPNKSLYLFAPSAYPIDKNKSYCRDFCLVFPSYNKGFGNNFSLQAGAFIIPGMPFDLVPIVLSGKYSLPQAQFVRLATGMMYVSFPNGRDSSFGSGFAFGTATFGNRFTHFSTTLGWGYVRNDKDWEFAEKPILVVAGNRRISNTFALVAEYWLPPEVDDPTDLPVAISARFIGRRIAVDVGGFFSIYMAGVPIPLINFTYHMK